jgi:hypothetical protein
MKGDFAVPAYADLLADLKRVRERGLGKLRTYRVDALRAACVVTDLSITTEQEPAAIETLLRKAIESLGGGGQADAAEYSLGLIGGTKLWPAAERRKRAAEAYGISVDRFRKAYELQIMEQIAEGILAACRETHMRRARLQLERRHPADSRLAVQWVERFEGYYRIWTPVWKLAADIEATIATYREPPMDHLPWDPDSVEAYDPVDQARGYARYALHAYAWYQLELRKFMIKHGGLWLLSDAAAELQASDAIYRIGWHNPLNEEDDSWLRRHLADARHEEQDHFKQLLLNTSAGSAIHDEWQDYIASCHCPTLDEPKPDCQPHTVIAASKEYCDLIDNEWLKIADWYHPGERPSRGIEAKELYAMRVGGRAKTAVPPAAE